MAENRFHVSKSGKNPSKLRVTRLTVRTETDSQPGDGQAAEAPVVSESEHVQSENGTAKEESIAQVGSEEAGTEEQAEDETLDALEDIALRRALGGKGAHIAEKKPVEDASLGAPRKTTGETAAVEGIPIPRTSRKFPTIPRVRQVSPLQASEQPSEEPGSSEMPSSGKLRRVRFSTIGAAERNLAAQPAPENSSSIEEPVQAQPGRAALAGKEATEPETIMLPSVESVSAAGEINERHMPLEVTDTATTMMSTLDVSSRQDEPSSQQASAVFEVSSVPTVEIPAIGRIGTFQYGKEDAARRVPEQNKSAFGPEELAERQTLSLPSVKEVADAETMALPAIRARARQEEVEQQQTLQLPISTPAMATAPASKPEFFLRRFINAGLARLQEPQPEGLYTRGLQAVSTTLNLGMFPLLTLTNALGLIVVAVSDTFRSIGIFSQEFLFLLGIAIVFVPNLLRLLTASALRLERIYLICGLGLFFYLISFIGSPLHFASFDEFLHWVTADAIQRTGHLFNDNSMLPVSPYYPGLEVVTSAISSVTGLNPFYASIPLILSGRLLMMLSLFFFYEQLTHSSRMAGIATVIYMVNPHFIFFDSIYNYETLALPLALFAFYILARYQNAGGEHRGIIFTSWLVLLALTFTHHMTDYVFVGLLLLWTATSFFVATPRRTRIHLLTLALFGMVCALAYAFLVNGNPVWGYLSPYFSNAFTQLGRIIAGTGASRPLFAGTAGVPTPIWDRLLMTGSVAIVAFGLPFGLVTLWQLHRRHALALMLGIFVLAYPVAQAFRFTPFGSEISDRSAAFLFLAVAYVLALLVTHFWPTRGLNKRTIAFLACALTIVLLGGVVLDLGPGDGALPGPYLVGADGASVEPEGINAALWASAYLRPGNRVGTDRTNQMLMGTYGEQHVVTELGDLIDVSPLFYSTQFDQPDIGLVRAAQVQYLVVDLRLSTATPANGFYFVSDEPQANHITEPISRTALTKFDTVPQIDRLFDSGNIVIYNTGTFLSG